MEKSDSTQSQGGNYVELLRHENISFRVLIEKDRQTARKILIQEFTDQQPLSNAFCLQFPSQYSRRGQVWSDFWQLYMDESIRNRMSIGLFDVDINQLIGVVTVKDIGFKGQGFQEKFKKGYNFVTAVVKIQEILTQQVKPQYQQLFKSQGVVVDFVGFAIRKKYMGRQLVHRAVKLSGMLAVKKGFKYSFVFATNFRSTRAAIKLGFQKIASYECKEFEFNGIRPFALVDQLHHQTSFWLKKLQ